MTIGSELQRARLRRHETTSEVAAATRMKVQTVEAIEREDFDTFAAPIYGKGFIRLYAEHVGLDPTPLINEYMARFANPVPPSLRPEEEDDEPEPDTDGADEAEPDLFSRMEAPRRKVETFGEKVRKQRRGRNVRTTPMRERMKALQKALRERIENILPENAPPDDAPTPEADAGGGTLPDDAPAPAYRVLVRWIALGLGLILVIILVLSGLGRLFNRHAPAAASPAPQPLRLIEPPPPPYFDDVEPQP